MSTPKKKTDRMAWFKMDAGRFLLAVAGLPAVHVAIYAKLLSIYWVDGHKLPADKAILKRKLGIGDEDEAALDAVLAEFFPDGQHPNLDAQLAEVVERGLTAAANGRKRTHGSASVPTSAPEDF